MVIEGDIMTYEKEVEVLSIMRVTESATGESMYQIVFGEVLYIDEELRKYVPVPPMSKPQKAIYPNSLILFAKFPSEVPYIVGSHWFLKIEGNGMISLKKAK
jgi:hypothetical protein